MNNEHDFEPVELQPKSSMRKRVIISVAIVLVIVILAVAAGLLFRHFALCSFYVDGPSMWPTLNGGNGPDNEPLGATDEEQKRIDTNGDIVYVCKLFKPRRGDIIVFKAECWEGFEDLYVVKRVIGLPGDHIRIVNNQLYLNGKLHEEPYIYEPMHTPDIDLVVPDGSYFCLGDNRNNSIDCRSMAPVTSECIIGRCYARKSVETGKYTVLKSANKYFED